MYLANRFGFYGSGNLTDPLVECKSMRPIWKVIKISQQLIEEKTTYGYPDPSLIPTVKTDSRGYG